MTQFSGSANRTRPVIVSFPALRGTSDIGLIEIIGILCGLLVRGSMGHVGAAFGEAGTAEG
jgi:hypothetical protein